MSSLASSYPLAEVTVPATGNTPVQLDSGGRSYRSGVSITNLSSTGTMYVRAQTDGATAPTSGNLTSATGWMYAIPPGGNLTQPWGTKVNLYAVADASVACTVSEIDSEGEMIGFSDLGNPSGSSALASCLNEADNRILTSGSCTAVRLAATGQVSSGRCKLSGYYVNVAGAGIGEIYDNPSGASGVNPICIAAAVGPPVIFPQPIPMEDGIWAVLTAGHNVTFFTEPI